MGPGIKEGEQIYRSPEQTPRKVIQVTPVEAAVIFLNEVFSKEGPFYQSPFKGHHNEAVAKFLHTSDAQKWISAQGGPARLEDFLQDIQKSRLLRRVVNQTLNPYDDMYFAGATFKLTARQKWLVRLRTGLEDGRLHTFTEMGQESGVTSHRIRQLYDKAMSNLRHSTRSKPLLQFLRQPSE